MILPWLWWSTAWVNWGFLGLQCGTHPGPTVALNPLLQSAEYFSSLEFMERPHRSQYLVGLYFFWALKFMDMNSSALMKTEEDEKIVAGRVVQKFHQWFFWIIRIKVSIWQTCSLWVFREICSFFLSLSFEMTVSGSTHLIYSLNGWCLKTKPNKFPQLNTLPTLLSYKCT